MAGAAGIEPANADTKNRCLTTWPRPIIALRGREHKAKFPPLQGPLWSIFQ